MNDGIDDHAHDGQVSATRADTCRCFERDVLPLTGVLYRVASRYTNNRTDAEDLVQETLLKAFRAFDRLTEDTNFKAWLLTIMRNTAINNYRATTRRPIENLVADISDQEGAVAARGVPKEAASAEYQALRHVMDADVLEAVLALSPEMRETVYFVAIERMKCREAAEVMGISPNTVLSRMHRIRHHLRQPLADIARQRRLLAQREEPDAA